VLFGQPFGDASTRRRRVDDTGQRVSRLRETSDCLDRFLWSTF
jgi:hypothetical protein